LNLSNLPPTLSRTRGELHRVAAHVLARARAQATGRFGLRVTVDGLGTPQFGESEEVLRLGAGLLLRERRAGDLAITTAMPIAGRSLTELADFAAVDLRAPLSVGKDTPPLGDPEAPLDLDVEGVEAVTSWFQLGARALDRMLVRSGESSTMQLWPEHFDVAIDVATAGGRANLGASPGDGFHADPYLYVGPWEGERPGDPDFWNAPFGAVMGHAELRAASDPLDAATSFFDRGLDLLD
jgi:hypothetical protein